VSGNSLVLILEMASFPAVSARDEGDYFLPPAVVFPASGVSIIVDAHLIEKIENRFVELLRPLDE
jgi:hypothetical protein